MRIAHHLLRSRFGVYHFRLKVPADLHAAVGRTIIKISLRTSDHRAAQAYSCALSLHYAQAFAALRGAAVPKLPPSIEALRKGAGDGDLQRYEIDIDPLTLRPTKVRTDGTPEDHMAALQTLGVVFAQALPQRPTATAGQVPRVPVKTAGLSLADAIRLYEEAEAPSLKPNTWSQRTRAFESLKTFLGADTPVASITRERAGDWAHDLITRVPAGKKKAMTKRTAGNTVSHSAQLFAFLSRRGKFEGANPLRNVGEFTEHPPGEYRAYKDLRQRNPNLKSRQRNFRTTGVLISVKEGWFKDKGLKEEFAQRLAAVFGREYSIGSQDIGYAATNISVRTTEGGGPVSDCIAIFDQTYGSLRLTERLYLQIGSLLDRMRAGLEAEGEPPERLAAADSFREWLSNLLPASVEQHFPEGVHESDRCVQVFQPGSKVCMRERGQMSSEVEIIGVTLMDSKLMYQVKAAPRYPNGAPVKQWVPATHVEPSAISTDWEHGWWDTEAQEYVSGTEAEKCAGEQ